MPDFPVHQDDAGQRLDRFLRKLLPQATLGHVHKLLRTGRVTVGGTRQPGAHRLCGGEIVTVRADVELVEALRAKPRAAARAGALTVVHRDEHLLVLDKPGGLAVHGGSDVADHLLGRVAAVGGRGGAWTFQPAPAHRIDRGTSGLVAFGLSAAGLRGMAARFREGLVRKLYLALVRGEPRPRAGEIDLPLRRGEGRAGRPKTAVAAAGKAARTRYRLLEHRRGVSLLEVELDGGRTHQIRAHLAAIGLPVLGDRRYGDRGPGFADRHRIALHAARLRFDHPVTQAPLDLEAPCPRDLRDVLDRLEGA